MAKSKKSKRHRKEKGRILRRENYMSVFFRDSEAIHQSSQVPMTEGEENEILGAIFSNFFLDKRGQPVLLSVSIFPKPRKN